ncbi:DUF3923 family protein [Agrilactobacillus yilanensis]|uniref:DUF3923 family protein n=1 Tax=Agrilactobacillus yilanensis TaxID=2485997 RepID=A0ABW4J8K7_9LACO|nr:DUF3923 family protein [Agrilactobacillus yilanensis]
MKKWWAVNVVWMFLFAAGTIYIAVSEKDSSGVIITPELRLVTLLLLGIIFLVVTVIQLTWGYFAWRKQKH